jgi:hypothetical protein
MSINEGCKLLALDLLIGTLVPEAASLVTTVEADTALYKIQPQVATGHPAQLKVSLRKRKPQRGIRMEIRNLEKEWITLSATERAAAVAAVLRTVVTVAVKVLTGPTTQAELREDLLTSDVVPNVMAYLDRRASHVAQSKSTEEDNDEEKVQEAPRPVENTTHTAPSTPAPDAPPPPPPVRPSSTPPNSTRCSPPPHTAGEDSVELQSLKLLAWMLRNRDNVAAALYELRTLPDVTPKEAAAIVPLVRGYPGLEQLASHIARAKVRRYPQPDDEEEFRELKRAYTEAAVRFSSP